MSAELHHLMLVFTVYAIAAASPGPSTMRIMGIAMNQGRQPALCLAAGVVSGSLFWGLLAATGISALLAEFSHALIVMKIVGGAYLLFLAFKAARSAMKRDDDTVSRAGMGPTVSGRTLFQRGLLMHLTNPKALLGWMATVTLGLGPTSSSSTVALILAGCAVLSIMIFCGYALIFSTGRMVRTYRKARRWIEGSLAAVFGSAGLKLIFTKLSGDC